MIKINLLKSYGGIEVDFKEDTYVFRKGEPANFYYQLIKGEVNIISMNNEGGLFTQSKIQHTDNKIFGCSAMFASQEYPASAIAKKGSQIIKITKEHFLTMLEEHPFISIYIIEQLSERLVFKSRMLRSLAIEDPSERILFLFREITKDCKEPKLISLTRQEIANLTALRVETVIRTIKKLEKEKKLFLKNRKVFYPPLKKD